VRSPRCWQFVIPQTVIGLGTDGILEDADCDRLEPRPSLGFALLSDVETIPENVYDFLASAETGSAVKCTFDIETIKSQDFVERS